MKNEKLLAAYWKSFIEFLSDKVFLFCLLASSVVSYGFYICNYSPNVEDLALDLYYGNNSWMLSTGRFGSVVLDKIFHIYNADNSLILRISGVLFLIITAVLLCCLFKKVTNNRMSKYSYVVFACFFVNAPILNEFLIYTNQALSIPLAFFFTTLALIFFDNKKNSLTNILSVVCLMVALSFYESFAAVFIMGVQIICILKMMYNEEEKSKLWYVLAKTAFIFAHAWVLKMALSSVMKHYIPHILPGYAGYTSGYIKWGDGATFASLIKGIWMDYFVAGLYYPQVATFVISIVVALALMVICRKYWIYFLLLILANFALPVLLGQAIMLRACQVFSFFCPFVFLILADHSKEVHLAKGLMIVLLLCQCIDLNKWFYVNDLRYREDVTTFRKLARDIEKFEKKPIIFVGAYYYSDTVMQHIGLRSDSKIGKFLIKNTSLVPEDRIERKYIFQKSKLLDGCFSNWGIVTEGVEFTNEYSRNTFAFIFWQNLGYYDFEDGSFNEENFFKAQAEDFTYIKDFGDFIAIRL